MRSYYYANPADYDDPPPPPEPGRCTGWDKGCGRFVANGGTLCPRCEAEIAAHIQFEIDEDKRIAAAIEAEQAYWQNYWQSPEGLAEIARDREQAARYAAEMADWPTDDLPY